MPVESATYLNDLNDSNPGGGESKTQGDDHLRLIKGVLKRTFPNLTDAVTLTAAVLNGLPARLATLEGQFLVSTLVKLAADLDANGFGLTNVRAPAADADVATKAYADTVYHLPLHSVLLTTTNVNPGVAVASGGLGYGTWTQIAQGRFIAGVGTGTDQNSNTSTATAGNTGGEYVHTLTTAELPAGIVTNVVFADGDGNDATNYGSEQNISLTKTPTGTPFNVTPPAFGVYVWERTA